MRIFYVTLNSQDDAERISRVLLEQQLAVCTNWFDIRCAYRWQGEIKSGPETVLIVKTRRGYKDAVHRAIQGEIDYSNFMGELDLESTNPEFLTWLRAEVPELGS